ncbi:MAG: hypothetical protein M1839_000826 [Geoglossum umbratile]|nr:MAG: hypothetical protein M1839_000826 [Geoglossum umbratile]
MASRSHSFFTLTTSFGPGRAARVSHSLRLCTARCTESLRYHKLAVCTPRVFQAHRRCASTGGTGGAQDYHLQPGQSQVSPSTQKIGTENADFSSDNGSGQSGGGWSSTLFKMFESAATTFSSLVILGYETPLWGCVQGLTPSGISRLAGYGYHKYYKHLVLQKIEDAFKAGDPILDLATVGRSTSLGIMEDEDGSEHWVVRSEQTKIDGMIDGSERGHYFLLIGEKGTGKSSMLIDAMRKVAGVGVSIFEAHADLEIFRIRLGKALDFEFHEDYIGSLFSIRGPRDTTALLDIERALNRLEKVALRHWRTHGRPLVLIINSMHLLRNDEDGRDLLELVQQRAEQWAASNLVTFIFNSDDYWVYERLKQYATRMEVVPVMDLPKDQALLALKRYRAKYFKEEPSPEMLEKVYTSVGGRLSFLNRVAKSHNMMEACVQINDAEKTWLLNQCGILGGEMDDDVMDQQKYASAALVLAKALMDKEKEMEKTYDPQKGHILPQLPLHEARYIMTRADFIQQYDHINIFTIDSKAMVRADSVPMQNAFREICGREGFEELLQATLDRIAAIESLGRTRELVAKDLWGHGKYSMTVRNPKGSIEKSIAFEADPENRSD